MNVYQRINAVRKAIGYIQKDKAVSAGAGGNYKAVTHDAVTGLVRQHLVEQGVVIVPSLVSCVFHSKEPEVKQRLYEAIYQVDFVNTDDPTDRLTIQVSAHALDNGDKAPGKALSYATKYAILKVFSLETGEDEESRYQESEFDAMPYCERLMKCVDMKSLQAAYKEFYRIAEDARSKEGMALIIRAKDAAKAKLATDIAGQA